MSYATAQDMINRYPNRDLVQLTNEDPTATTINTTPITQALTDASAEIDGYIEGRFTLPLTDPPAVLNRLTTDIAMYRMQSLRPLHDLEDARKRYEDAVAMLVESCGRRAHARPVERWPGAAQARNWKRTCKARIASSIAKN